MTLSPISSHLSASKVKKEPEAGPPFQINIKREPEPDSPSERNVKRWALDFPVDRHGTKRRAIDHSLTVIASSSPAPYSPHGVKSQDIISSDTI